MAPHTVRNVIVQWLLVNLPHPHEALRNFARMCDILRSTIAPLGGRDTRLQQSISFLWSRLGKASCRLSHLYTLWKAGKYRPAPKRAPSARKSSPRDPACGHRIVSEP